MDDVIYFYLLFVVATLAFLTFAGTQLYPQSLVSLVGLTKDNTNKKINWARRRHVGLFLSSLAIQIAIFVFWFFALFRILISPTTTTLALELKFEKTYYAFLQWTLTVCYSLLSAIIQWKWADKLDKKTRYQQWLISLYLICNVTCKITHDVLNFKVSSNEMVNAWFMVDVASIAIFLVTIAVVLWRPTIFQSDDTKLPKITVFEAPFYLKLIDFDIAGHKFPATFIVTWYGIQLFAAVTYLRNIERLWSFFAIVLLLPLTFDQKHWISVAILCEEAFWTAYWILPAMHQGLPTDFLYTLIQIPSMNIDDVMPSMFLVSFVTVTSIPILFFATCIPKKL